MTPAPAVGPGLAVANSRMDRVLAGLTLASPEVLEGCAVLIEQACHNVRAVLSGPACPDREPETLAAVLQLRAKIRHARCLLEHAYKFHLRCGQMVGALTAGYLPGGQAAPVPGSKRLWVRG